MDVSYWPCYRFSAIHTDLWMAVLARGFALGQYSHPLANTTDPQPVIGPV